MKVILIGWLTVGLALLWDRFLNLVKVKETTRSGFLIPLSEELLKFAAANLNNLAPPLLYAFFGLGEGIYETIHLKKRFDLVTVLAGILTHTFFSIFYIFKIPVLWSLLLAILSHLIWNKMILYLNAFK